MEDQELQEIRARRLQQLQEQRNVPVFYRTKTTITEIAKIMNLDCDFWPN